MIQLSEAIPYVRQAAPKMCGAAALDMVYKSLGLDCPQLEIWPEVTGGHPCARTHLLAADAARRGFSAVVVQAARPWDVLERCADQQVRVIMNHRPTTAATTGHYTVLLDVAPQWATMHDPQFGPKRREMRESLIELWTPSLPVSEITGNVLVAVSDAPAKSEACGTCGTPMPESIECVRCRRPIRLRPAASLGCLKAGCDARLWRRIFCPHCDAGYSELLSPGLATHAPTLDEFQRQAIRPAQGMQLPEMLQKFTHFVVDTAEQLPDSDMRTQLLEIAAAIKQHAAELPDIVKQEAEATAKAMEKMRKRLDEIPAEIRQRLDAAYASCRTSRPIDVPPDMDPAALGEMLLKKYAPSLSDNVSTEG